MQLMSASGEPQWYGSGRVKVPATGLDHNVDKIANRAIASSDGALWLDEAQTKLGGPSQKQLRRQEDLEAIGGLRSPHGLC